MDRCNTVGTHSSEAHATSRLSLKKGYQRRPRHSLQEPDRTKMDSAKKDWGSPSFIYP